MSKRKKNKSKEPKATPNHGSGASMDLKYLAAALLGCIIVYFTSLQNGFVNWDDPANFLDNPWIANPNQLSLADRLAGIFTTDVLGNPRVDAPDMGAYEYDGTVSTEDVKETFEAGVCLDGLQFGHQPVGCRDRILGRELKEEANVHELVDENEHGRQ